MLINQRFSFAETCRGLADLAEHIISQILYSVLDQHVMEESVFFDLCHFKCYKTTLMLGR